MIGGINRCQSFSYAAPYGHTVTRCRGVGRDCRLDTPRNAARTKQVGQSFPADLSMSGHRSDQVLRQDLPPLSGERDRSMYVASDVE